LIKTNLVLQVGGLIQQASPLLIDKKETAKNPLEIL
jgi:hypothetical protein